MSQCSHFKKWKINKNCPYLQFFKLKLSRCPQFKKLQTNKNCPYLQFFKTQFVVVPSIQKVSKFKNFQAKIALMPPIQNISKTHETNCLHTSNSKKYRKLTTHIMSTF